MNLAFEIDPDQSIMDVSAKKIELKLKKVIEGSNWNAVEKGGPQVLMATAQNLSGGDHKPSYPTSSKTG
jgi:hypothetical protein